MRRTKKIFDMVMTVTAKAALKAALSSVGYASHASTYQPKEPEVLTELNTVECAQHHFDKTQVKIVKRKEDFK